MTPLIIRHEDGGFQSAACSRRGNWISLRLDCTEKGECVKAAEKEKCPSISGSFRYSR